MQAQFRGKSLHFWRAIDVKVKVATVRSPERPETDPKEMKPLPTKGQETAAEPGHWKSVSSASSESKETWSRDRTAVSYSRVTAPPVVVSVKSMTSATAKGVPVATGSLGGCRESRFSAWALAASASSAAARSPARGWRATTGFSNRSSPHQHGSLPGLSHLSSEKDRDETCSGGGNL